MALILNSVTKRFAGQTDQTAVLKDVSLHLDPGASLALTGESGSGKSTLLHLVAALDTFDHGEISLNGTRYSTLSENARAALRRRNVSIVFQQFNLIPSLTVDANIALHARIANRYDAQWCDQLITRLGLRDLIARYPENLSGGQQQRVAIARALAVRPDVLLADEPTGNLDEQSSSEVIDLMLDLVRDHETALFLVTHSSEIAARLDRRLHLQHGRVVP